MKCPALLTTDIQILVVQIKHNVKDQKVMTNMTPMTNLIFNYVKSFLR